MDNNAAIEFVWPKDAQRCSPLTGCCFYLNGSKVMKNDYEAAVSRFPRPPRQTPGNPTAIQETHIPCQNTALHTAVEQITGFYLGEPRDRTSAFSFKAGAHLNAYSAKTHEYLRIATEEDVKLWNDIFRAESEKVLAMQAAHHGKQEVENAATKGN